MRKSVLLVAASVLTFAATVHAKPPVTATRSSFATSKESLPPLPPPATPTPSPLPPTPSPAAAKASPETPPAARRGYEESPTGPTFDFGMGGRFIQGALSQESSSFNAFGFAMRFRGGYYMTRHIGLLAGLEGSFGFLGKGCTGGRDATCAAFSVSLPVTAQYAFASRTRGAYVEGGLSFLNVQLFTAHPTSSETQVVTMFSPVDLTLGAGYRIDIAPEPKAGQTGAVIELSLRADIGQYWSGSFRDGAGSASGSVAPGDRAFHVAATLNAARRF